MNSLWQYILTPTIIITTLGAITNAYNNAQTQAKLDQILTAVQPQGMSGISRMQLNSARYAL